jgi:HEAT repeat protein
MVDFDSWEDLIKALINSESNVETWLAASEAIYEMAKPEHIPELYQLLESAEGDYNLEEVAAKQLARLEGIKVLPTLLKTLIASPNEQDSDGLLNVIYSLIMKHPDEVLPYLLSLVDSPDAAVRQKAAWTLGLLHPRVNRKIFEKLASDEDAVVRAAALGSVSRFIGQEWAFEILLNGLDDSASNVQISAIISLREFNDNRAISFIRKYLNDAKLMRFAQDSINRLQRSGRDTL